MDIGLKYLTAIGIVMKRYTHLLTQAYSDNNKLAIETLWIKISILTEVMREANCLESEEGIPLSINDKGELI